VEPLKRKVATCVVKCRDSPRFLFFSMVMGDVMKILFLDIDGVLNNHAVFHSGYCGLKASCVQNFNHVLHATNCKIVVSSAWRYMILKGDMTLRGFEHLLSSHGVDARDRIIGNTRQDCEDLENNDRGLQISEWLIANHSPPGSLQPYAVVDDLDLMITQFGHPFVQTDGQFGLTPSDAMRLIELLSGKS